MQAKGTKSTSFLMHVHKERSGPSTLGLQRCLTLCLLGNLHAFLLSADFFSKSTFLKNSFRNTIRVSNGVDPDQAQNSPEGKDLKKL